MSEAITLLATTRGRAAPLQRLFESLRSQAFRDFTLLLGDQNPEGYLDELLAAYAGTFAIERVRLPPLGLSAARNALLPHVRGSLVALADDDCYYAPDSLGRVAGLFAARPDVAAVVGNANAAGDCGAAVKGENRFTVFRSAPSWVLFFRARAMRAVGLFDEGLGIGSAGPWQSGEETDYLLRLLALGEGAIARAPGVKVFHDAVEMRGDKACERARAYGLGRMRVIRKHRLPLWFALLNVAWPLAGMLRGGAGARQYHKAVFLGRLAGMFGGGRQAAEE